ncbi:class I SAM-dependent methyltransferase family protein [Halobacteria archaeon AArc-curdl1]|uniref:tRNA(Phe) (4-demethylwyosine(37)-C(7)) aminocarboxypropyltransferase n=1 Tax=Natronosalvus hydrolyticus TaxID=2979988 RepID=A0AAP3E767_9EURY|nr:class I SAM-dependent methyltransferase family protein [Halobacteria archaeon AArc-curdl1]
MSEDGGGDSREEPTPDSSGGHADSSESGDPSNAETKDTETIVRASTDEADSLEALETGPLAAVVDAPRSEAAIEALRTEDVYDDDRRVRPYGENGVALPVTAPPESTAVREVIRQVDPEYRTSGLEDHLRERGWSDADLESAPGSWAVIGSVVLVRLPQGCPDETAVADALLDLHGEAETVLADEGIANDTPDDSAAGTYREPRTRVLAGSSDTETVHVEDGTSYGLDPQRVMFSPGNQAERRRMADVVDSGEHVFDMFAGIGYFSLPMARAGASVTATELNPTAFRYLLENAVANDVSQRLDAYHSDCRELAPSLEVDRVVMGYYGVGDGTDDDGHGMRTNEAEVFLPAALEALVPGGIVHYHEATPEAELWDRPLERLERAADAAGRALTVLETRRVKSHSAGVEHVVVDARFDVLEE